jgi:anaerobic magnesium-protoporphyrin IX monomethyl ester cyclase
MAPLVFRTFPLAGKTANVFVVTFKYTQIDCASKGGSKKTQIMKFLLIRPGDKSEDSKHVMLPPLGLLYLGAVLENDGHKVEILDYSVKNISKEQLNNSLLSSDTIGVHIQTTDFKTPNNILKMIKDIDSNIPLIIGGPHCTFVKKQSLHDIPLADISVSGEGEFVILDLVKYLQGNKKPSDINGVFYRDNGSIYSGKPLKIIRELDSIPFPARHLVDNYVYGNSPHGFQFSGKVTSLISSRGCPCHCRFCTRYANMIDGWGFRQRSAENVVKEFAEIDDIYGSVNVVDDNFLADKKRAHKIFDGLIKNDKKFEIVIHGARVDSADKDLYKKMRKAGVKYLYFGIESGNQDVLDYYQKNITLSQIRNAVKLSRKMNFVTMGSFIFGAPIETDKHIENSIDFACSLPLDFANFVPLKYIKGSQIWDEAVKNNKISEDSDTFFALSDKNDGLGNFTKNELMEYTIKAFYRFYNRPSYFVHQMVRSISRNDFKFLLNGLRFLFFAKKEIDFVQKNYLSKK